MATRIKIDPVAAERLIKKGITVAAEVGTRAIGHALDSVLGDIGASLGGAGKRVREARSKVQEKLREITPEEDGDGDG